MITRRNLLVALGAGAFAAALPAHAQQQARIWRVGVLNSRGRADTPGTDYRAVFVPAMRELGYVEGRNLAIEWRFADGSAESLPAMAQELVRLKVDLIVTDRVIE